jgi:hypothetical protein
MRQEDTVTSSAGLEPDSDSADKAQLLFYELIVDPSSSGRASHKNKVANV